MISVRCVQQTKVILQVTRITKAHDRGTPIPVSPPVRCSKGKSSVGIDTRMDDLHKRIARVTEDLGVIQRELNCVAMQAPSNPELMEALNSVAETDAIEILCTALDQMRHFLWFYSQVMRNDHELGDTLHESDGLKPIEVGKVGTSFLDQLTRADEAVLLCYLAEAKEREPN